MSPGKQKKSRAVLRVVSLVLILITATAPTTNTPAHPSQARKNLAPVHWPKLDGLEPEVRDQLLEVENTLTEAINHSAIRDSELATTFGESGKIYHAYSFFLPARDCYLNAAVLVPKDFRWPYLLAKIDQQEGRSTDAIKRFQHAGTLEADYVAIDVNVGNIYLELNIPDQAEASFKRALAREPKNAAALNGLGQVKLSQRQYAEAASYFEKALQQVPAANRIHYSLALAYRGLGDLAKAETHLAQRGTVGIRVVDPLFDQLSGLIEGERVHLARGRIALEARRFQDAAAEFRKAIAAKPESASAHFNLGTVLMQTNDHAGAAAEFETVLRLEPDYANAHYNLAIVLATQGKHDQAIGHLQSHLARSPDDVAARFFSAQELLKANRRDEALSEFAQVSRADPENEAALLEEVKLLEQKKRYREAVDRLAKSHKAYPQRGQTAAMLAYFLAASPQYDLRDGRRGLELAQRVFQASGLPQHGALVAMALAELGRCTEAADWQRKMIALAEQNHQTELVSRLKSDLELYEVAQSCRPR